MRRQWTRLLLALTAGLLTATLVWQTLTRERAPLPTPTPEAEAPVLVAARLEEFAYGEATAIALVLLVASLVMLAIINLLERWSHAHAA